MDTMPEKNQKRTYMIQRHFYQNTSDNYTIGSFAAGSLFGAMFTANPFMWGYFAGLAGLGVFTVKHRPEYLEKYGIPASQVNEFYAQNMPEVPCDEVYNFYATHSPWAKTPEASTMVKETVAEIVETIKEKTESS